MRVIDFHGPSQYWARFAPIDSQHLAVPSGKALLIVDPEKLPAGRVSLGSLGKACLASLQGVTCAAYGPDSVVTCDESANLCLHAGRDNFRGTVVLRLPDEFRPPKFPYATHLERSPSGRYVMVRMSGGVSVIDLTLGVITFSVACRSPAGHGSFSRAPDGQEVLFLAAPSYMSLALIDPATGQVRAHFEPTSGFDFCHTSTTFLPGGTSLLAFGCQWAGPTAARIYDARPWLAGHQIFQLPLLFDTEGTVIYRCSTAGELVSMDSQPGPDGALVYSIFVDLGDIPRAGSQDDQELREDASPTDLELLTQLQDLGDCGGAVVFRKVDAGTGQVGPPTIFSTGLGRAQGLARQRVAVIGDCVEVVDLVNRAVLHLGPISQPREAHIQCLSDDLTTLLIRSWPSVSGSSSDEGDGEHQNG